MARAELGVAFATQPGDWPWATLIVNLAGALVLGYVAIRHHRWRPLLGTGFCGALTTFSTMQLELLQMLDADRVGLALAYAAVSVAFGLGAAALGMRFARA
ncbi:MAG: fluoride exporter [Thermoleophilaceae bacterium]|jgi:CrcB protein|nr:fluoride exporter [Thermoleophilaceae bacterium]